MSSSGIDNLKIIIEEHKREKINIKHRNESDKNIEFNSPVKSNGGLVTKTVRNIQDFFIDYY